MPHFTALVNQHDRQVNPRHHLPPLVRPDIRPGITRATVEVIGRRCRWQTSVYGRAALPQVVIPVGAPGRAQEKRPGRCRKAG